MTEPLLATPTDDRSPRVSGNSSGHCVRDIMTTPVHSVEMDDSVLSVKRLFEREGCHHVVVMKNLRARGVVSDRDVLKVLSPFVGNKMMERAQDVNTLTRLVHQIMSRDLVTIGPEESLTVTAEKMLGECVSCLPVVDDDGIVVGIVTVRDFVKWSLDSAGATARHPAEPDQDEGVLVIIDGARCYSPDAKLARKIREAERRDNA